MTIHETQQKIQQCDHAFISRVLQRLVLIESKEVIGSIKSTENRVLGCYIQTYWVLEPYGFIGPKGSTENRVIWFDLVKGCIGSYIEPRLIGFCLVKGCRVLHKIGS